MIQSEQKNKHRQRHALRTLISAALILSCLCLLSSCRQKITYADTSLSAGLTARIAGTDGNYSSAASAPASRGALITTSNFGTYYESFAFQAFKSSDMSVPYATDYMAKSETNSNTGFYGYYYRPGTDDDVKWPSEKDGEGKKQFVPLSFFCYAGDDGFAPSVSFSGSASTATLTSYTVPTDVSKQKDCLIGITNFVTPKIEGTGEDAEFVANAYIYFSHALSAINFEVGSITPGIIIKSLTLSGVYGTGSLTATRSIGSENSQSSKEYYTLHKKGDASTVVDGIKWTPSGSKNASYIVTLGTSGFEIIGTGDAGGRTATQQAVYDGDGKLTTHGAMIDASTDLVNSLILLPQEITDAKLTIKYTYRGTEFEQTADIKDVTWLRSHKYIYALNLTLQEFGFTLYVQDWVNGGTFPEEGYNW